MIQFCFKESKSKMPEVGIVCTIGPKTVKFIPDFQKYGMKIARFNGSFLLPFKKILKTEQLAFLLDIPRTRKKQRRLNHSEDELIRFSLENSIDYIALSYLENAGEIDKYADETKKSPIKIVSKIETASALEHADSIINHPATELIMIDRGDLAEQIGYEKIPEAQEYIVSRCVYFGKPVIVATEMMMSTLTNTISRPYIADVSDVYHAVKQGASYVMLSEETAIGTNPVNAVSTVQSIIANIV